jgi:hypothetical protein
MAKSLVEQVAQRLREIEVNIAALVKEKNALRGAVTGKVTVRATTAAKAPKAPKTRKVSKAAKAKQSKLRAAAWADVHKLLKAGKIKENSLAARAAYYKANPKT